MKARPLAPCFVAVCAASAFACSGSGREPFADHETVDLPADPAPASPVHFPRRKAPRATLAPEVVDLGAVPAFEDAAFDVPPDTLGLNVVVQTDLDHARIGVLRIVSPTGEVVHDRYTPKGGTHATSISDFTSIAAAAVPQGQGIDARPLATGTWRVMVGDGRQLLEDGSAPPPPFLQVVPPMRVRVVLQRGANEGGAFPGARLDVVVHVPDGLLLGERPIDATVASTDASIAERFRVYFTGMKALFDIDPGDIRYEPAPAALKSLDAQSLEHAFSVARDHDAAQALHVVLTNDVMLGIGTSAWGVSPGVPGAAVLNGTPMSGVVLSIGDTDPMLDGLVLLHESSHFFGLSHTSELDGKSADPLDDTPSCSGLTPDPASVAGCPDRTNLMFPTYSADWAASLEVSDTQRAIVQSSPVLRVYGEARAAPRRPSRPFSVVSALGRAPVAAPAWRALCR